MAIDMLNGKVRVYNYGLSGVGFPSQHSEHGVYIRGRDEDEPYVVERVAFDDIEIENSKSDIFKVGLLRFHPDEEDEIYEKLGIDDRENIKTDEELMEILSDNSIENIKRISKIKSNTLINRMINVLFSMERQRQTPDPNISAAVIERSKELSYGKQITNSRISQLIDQDNKAKEEAKMKELINQLSTKIEQLENEVKSKDQLINESQQALKDLLNEVKNLKQNNSKEENGNSKSAKKTSTKSKKG